MDSQNVITQINDFESRFWAQTQKLYIIKRLNMSQINPNKFSTKLYSQFNHYTLPVTPLKGKLTHPKTCGSKKQLKINGLKRILWTSNYDLIELDVH